MAVALLACAFASVARQGRTVVSKFWLTGWTLIALHFAVLIVLPNHAIWGDLASDIALESLTAAGILFMYAAIPFRNEPASRLMLTVHLATLSLYVILLGIDNVPAWDLDFAAVLLGAGPLFVAITAENRFEHFMRWVTVLLFCGLAVFLLFVQHRPQIGAGLALNAVLFTVYLACSIQVWHTFRRPTAGSLITIAGFFAWAGVFVVAPLLDIYAPTVHIEGEVWNLPKYVVAVGMILLLLEDQIEHNKYLALHDELTGLPNRRLFLDRLAISMERARRMGSKTALLVIDLNHFKQVNDTLGHHTGDLLLQTVSSLFAGRVRRSDTVARTGGDEFSLILEEPTNRSNARLVAQSLMQTLKEPLQVGEHLVQVGASIGVAIFPDDATNIEGLCIAADLKMYDDKHVTRDSTHPFGVKSVPSSAFDEGTGGLKSAAH
jgi:diguanylate cyclase (GGDEF)-like protein